MATYRLTPEWSLEMDEEFQRRIEDGNLVLWRPGKTIWIAAFEDDIPLEEQLAVFKEESHPNPLQAWEFQQGDVYKYGYLVPRGEGDERAWDLTTFSIAPTEYILMSFYFDEESDLAWAKAAWESVLFEVNPA